MRSRVLTSVVLIALVAFLTVAAPAHAADKYSFDPAHTGVYFKIEHLGISWTFGRFDDVAGKCTIDKDDPSKSSFAMTIKTESLDTNHKIRDDHLRSPEFFHAKQFPVITFTSTAVKAVADGYEVTGDFTLHGVTKSITFPLKGGKEAEFPKGAHRIGFTTELTLKRSDYGMDKLLNAVGDEVIIAISFEGVRK
jgi:polyisoprenoid-binding protein YceI